MAGLNVEVKLEGLQEAFARLEELGALGQQKQVLTVLRRSARPTLRAATSAARGLNGSGALAKAMKVAKVKTLKGQEVARIVVAPTAKDRTAVFVHNAFYNRKRRGIFYGHLVEWGHRIGTRATGWLQKQGRGGKGGTAAGRVPGRPWFTPAVMATRNDVTTIFLAEMKKAATRLQRRKNQRTANPEGLLG